MQSHKAVKQLLLFLALSLATLSQAQWLPEKTNRLVNDYSGMLSSSQAADLEHRLEAFSDSTSNQVLVIITPTLGGDDENAVAQRIGQSWGVGQKDFNNGVVILIKSKTDEENWGAVAIATGYGAEGALPDLFCKRIIDDCMLSPLGNGDYYKAIDEALEVILPVLAGEYSYAQYRKDERRSLLLALGSMLLIIVALVVVLRSYAKKHPEQFHNNNGGKGGGMWFGGPVGGSSWGGRSSWGGGSSWGGFGGGSFGGGGASGRF